jgi:hypothetical protein
MEDEGWYKRVKGLHKEISNSFDYISLFLLHTVSLHDFLSSHLCFFFIFFHSFFLSFLLSTSIFSFLWTLSTSSFFFSHFTEILNYHLFRSITIKSSKNEPFQNKAQKIKNKNKNERKNERKKEGCIGCKKLILESIWIFHKCANLLYIFGSKIYIRILRSFQWLNRN